MAGRGRPGHGGGRPRAVEEIVPVGNVIAPNLMVVDVKFRNLVVEAGLTDADPVTCIRWLASRGLLVNSRECDVCPGHVRCRLQNEVGSADHWVWRCPNCTFTASIRRGSFFT